MTFLFHPHFSLINFQWIKSWFSCWISYFTHKYVTLQKIKVNGFQNQFALTLTVVYKGVGELVVSWTWKGQARGLTLIIQNGFLWLQSQVLHWISMCGWEESTQNPNGPTVTHTHTPCRMATDPLEFPWLIICHGLSFARLEFHSLRMQNIRQDVWCFCSSGLPVCRVDQSVQCRCYTVHTQLCVQQGCTWATGARPQCGSVRKWMVLSVCSHILPEANADINLIRCKK